MEGKVFALMLCQRNLLFCDFLQQTPLRQAPRTARMADCKGPVILLVLTAIKRSAVFTHKWPEGVTEKADT